MTHDLKSDVKMIALVILIAAASLLRVVSASAAGTETLTVAGDVSGVSNPTSNPCQA